MVVKDNPDPPSGFWCGTEVSTKLVSAATLDVELKAEVMLCKTPDVISNGVIKTVPTVITKNRPKINIVARASNTGFLNRATAWPTKGIGIIRFTTIMTMASVINPKGSWARALIFFAFFNNPMGFTL